MSVLRLIWSILVPGGTGLYGFFVALGIVLVLLGLVFGFTLGDVNRWIDAHDNWFEAIGMALFRLASGVVLLVCVMVVGAVFIRQTGTPRPHWGGVAAAVVIGYFAWIGMTAPL